MIHHNKKSDICKERGRLKWRTVLGLLCAAALLFSGCGKRAEPAPTPEPTPTPAPTPHWEAAQQDFLLFTGNSTGGKALGAWLMSEGAVLAAEYIPPELTEPLFTLSFTPKENAGGIPAAGEETRYILLSVDRQVLESGLLQAILPEFESSYGYVVEICTGEPEDVQSWAGVNAADAALLSESCASGLSRRGFSAAAFWAKADFELVF